MHGDASVLDIAKADLCIIRQVLQHLDNASIENILQKAAVHRHVLITEHLPSAEHLVKANVDKRSGPDTRLSFGSGVFVECPPFMRQGETVLCLPVEVKQEHSDEIMRTTLITNG